MKRSINEEDFQMAPMIDMVFLLLVFFMTVSTLAQEERLPLELAESTEAEVAEDGRHRGVFSITMEPEGMQIWHGMRAVDTNGMQTMTRQWLAAEPELKLQLRIARNVPFAEVRGLLQSAAEAGATRIIYSAFQK